MPVRPAPPVAPVVPLLDDRALAESQLLSAAVQQLRRQRDPKAALGVLDAYDAQFPQGQLRPEAVWLRVQAMVELGQRTGALKVLDALQLSADPERSTEPLVLRGRLRSEAGRCAEAIADFDAAATLSSGELLESILLHRGGCRARVGDLPGARADYSVYLVRFPTGRYTEAVEAALRALPGGTER